MIIIINHKRQSIVKHEATQTDTIDYTESAVRHLLTEHGDRVHEIGGTEQHDTLILTPERPPLAPLPKSSIGKFPARKPPKERAPKAEPKPRKGGKRFFCQTCGDPVSYGSRFCNAHKPNGRTAPELEARACELLRTGYTAVQVSQEIGLAVATVKNIRKRNHIVTPARTAGTPPRPRKSRVKKQRTAAESYQLVWDMKLKGAGDREIADTLRVGSALILTVGQDMRAQGIATRGKGKRKGSP